MRKISNATLLKLHEKMRQIPETYKTEEILKFVEKQIENCYLKGKSISLISEKFYQKISDFLTEYKIQLYPNQKNEKFFERKA